MPNSKSKIEIIKINKNENTTNKYYTKKPPTTKANKVRLSLVK